MKIVKCKIGYNEDNYWEEELQIPNEADSKDYLNKILDDFNTQEIEMHGDKARIRKLISIGKELTNSPARFCDFEKQNLVTDSSGADTLKCRNCNRIFKRTTLHTPQHMICKLFIEFQKSTEHSQKKAKEAKMKQEEIDRRSRTSDAFSNIEAVLKGFKQASWKTYNEVEEFEKIKSVVENFLSETTTVDAENVPDSDGNTPADLASESSNEPTPEGEVQSEGPEHTDAPAETSSEAVIAPEEPLNGTVESADEAVDDLNELDESDAETN